MASNAGSLSASEKRLERTFYGTLPNGPGCVAYGVVETALFEANVAAARAGSLGGALIRSLWKRST